MIKKGFRGSFNAAGSIWLAVIILIGVYFLLLAFRKTSDEISKVEKKKKDDIKEDVKDDNKNNTENEIAKNKDNDKEINKENEKEKTE